MMNNNECLIGRTINVRRPPSYSLGYGRILGGYERSRRQKENNAGEASTSRHHASSSRMYSRDFNEMIVQCKILAWSANTKRQFMFVVSSYDASVDMHLVTLVNGATEMLKLSPREEQPAKKLEGSRKQEKPRSKSYVNQSCDHLRQECKRRSSAPHSRILRAFRREAGKKVKEESSSEQTTSAHIVATSRKSKRPAVPAVDKALKKNKKTLEATPSTLPVIDLEETSQPVLNEGNPSELLSPSHEVLNMGKKLLQELCGNDAKKRIDAMSDLARPDMLTGLFGQLGCFLGPVLKDYETMHSLLSIQNGEKGDLLRMLSDKETELDKAYGILQEADRALSEATEEIAQWKNRFDGLQLRSSQDLDSAKQELSQVKNELSQVKELSIASP